MPRWVETVHSFLVDKRPSLHAQNQMPLSSKAKAGGSVRIHSSLLEECSKESRVQQSGWYTTIYEDWIRSLSFEDNK